MKKLFVFVTVLAVTLCVVPQLWAKTFYLKNGEQIEYQSYWQKEGRVYVLINRDTLVDFAPDEVDLAKTAKAAKAAKAAKPAHVKKKARHHKKKVKSPVAPKRAAPNASKVQEKQPAPAASPVPGVKPVPAPAAAAKTVPAPVPLKQQQAAAKPVPAPAPSKQQAAAKLPIQGAASSAKKTAVAAVVEPGQPLRPNLPLAKPAPVQAARTLVLQAIIANGVYVLVLTVIMIVALCKVFAKAGEAWWKALIPIYGMFVLVSIAGKPWWWGILMFVPLVNIFIYIIVSIALAKRFGEGVLYGFGLALVGFVFFPLLAFGKAEYR